MFGVVVLVVAAVGALSTHPLWTHAGSPGAQEDKPATSGDESVKTLSMNCYISSVTIFFSFGTRFGQNLKITNINIFLYFLFPPFEIVRRPGISTYIVFTKYLDIMYIY